MKQVIRLLGCGRHSLSGALVTDLRVAYAPPTGANREAAARFKVAYDQILSHILNSFVISSTGSQ